MKQPNVLLKLAAVTSAVFLVGGLIAFRVGAFDTPTHIDPPKAETPPEPTPVSVEADTTATLVDPSIMASSSKSAGVVIPVSPPSTEEKKPVPKTFIGGSKSLAPLLPPKSETSPGPAGPPR